MIVNNIEGQFKTELTFPDEKNFIVLVGGNNSGKSTILRCINKTFAPIAFRVDVNRTILKGEGAPDKSYLANYNAYVSNIGTFDDDNTERPSQILQDFFKLKNKERIPIIEWYNKYFPNEIYEEREDVENDASPMFLKVNGFPITKQGSGMRSTLEIFIKLFDPTIKILCVDEPELGLEPILQKYLFQALKDLAGSNKKIIIATHSHHFLDYETIDNNYICERDTSGKISVTQVKEIPSVVFRLLGNTLSSVFLPENILILEGSSDSTFLKKSLNLLGKKNYTIHSSGGDGNIGYAIGAITQFLKFNRGLSVYKENVFVIVDKPNIKDTIIRGWKILLPDEKKQFKVLSQNGIEYYYPEHLLQGIFKTSESREKIIDEYLKSVPNKFNSISITKNELAQAVAEMLEVKDFEDKGNELFEFLKMLP